MSEDTRVSLRCWKAWSTPLTSSSEHLCRVDCSEAALVLLDCIIDQQTRKALSSRAFVWSVAPVIAVSLLSTAWQILGIDLMSQIFHAVFYELAFFRAQSCTMCTQSAQNLHLIGYIGAPGVSCL